MNQKEKTKFRASAKWKKFRVYMKKVSGGVDAVTGKPLRPGWNLHHEDEKHYDDLKPEKFKCLNKQSHEAVHWLSRYANYKEVADNLVAIVKEMKKYEFESKEN